MQTVKRVSTKVQKLANIALWKTFSKRSNHPEIHIVAEGQNGSQMGTVYEVRGDCFIDPCDGYIICNGHVLWDSMRPNYDPNANVSKLAVPSFTRHRRVRNGTEKANFVSTALNCRHFFEWNYYHFFMDVLSKVPVFEAIDDTNASPFIVGNYVNQLAFASQTFSTTSLNRYTWLIQNESYIRSDCVRFCHVTSAYKDRIDWINSQVSSPVKEQKNECIYLTRGKSSGRKVLNESELICVLKKYGFKVVDTNGKHILDQAAIFKNARYVVAPHGAGLTNILFRGSNPLSILELHPIHEYTDFKRMCDCFGHQWHSLMGRVVPGDVRHADFTINVSDFETKLAELLAT